MLQQDTTFTILVVQRLMQITSMLQQEETFTMSMQRFMRMMLLSPQIFFSILVATTEMEILVQIALLFL